MNQEEMNQYHKKIKEYIIKKEFIRQLPGRIIGQTVDKNNTT